MVGAASHSSLQHHAPCHANRMQLVRIHYSSYQLVVKQTISAYHRQFIYTTYHCQSSLERVTEYGRPQYTIFRIVATVIDYFSLLVTACHRLFTYHCLAPVLAGKNEHRLVLFAGKSEHHLDLINTCFTLTNFMFTGHRQSTSGSARMRLPFPSQTYAHMDTTNCKYRYGYLVRGHQGYM